MHPLCALGSARRSMPHPLWVEQSCAGAVHCGGLESEIRAPFIGSAENQTTLP